MLTNLRSIKFIPNSVKKLVINEINHQIKLTGHRNVSQHYKLQVIEFTNKKRMWFLEYEILSDVNKQTSYIL